MDGQNGINGLWKLALLTLVLSILGMVAFLEEAILSASSADSGLFKFIDSIHGVLAIAIILFVGYRWTRLFGERLIVLYLVLHLPWLFLTFPNDPWKLAAMISGMGLAWLGLTIVTRQGQKDEPTDPKPVVAVGNLTNMGNRVLFQDRLGRAIAQAQRAKKPMALLFLDMDNFKDVNHTLGHEAGDKVLGDIADRLKGIARSSDSIGHLGGDEFGVVAVDIEQPEGAAFLAERVISAIEEPFRVGDNTILLGCTVGVAVYVPDSGGDDEVTPEELLTQADIAVDRAKSHGKSTIAFYDEAMGKRTQDRVALLRDLRGALARDEFILHYQPVAEIQTGKITAVEALIRWNRLGKEMVSPLDFIPLAESSGLILPIGEWVIRTACKQAVEWQTSGKTPVRVGVNLSSVQFKRQDIVSVISKALDESGLAPSMLDLELTESVLMDTSLQTHQALSELRSMGASVSLDDFGTGYSSLAYLGQFPIDVLKIDRSFVAKIPSSKADDAIAQTIITLGRLLNMKVLAEGVEFEQQRSRLVALGCDLAQGPLFGKPIPANELSKRLDLMSDPDAERVPV